MRNPEYAREQLLARFNRIPNLHFSSAIGPYLFYDKPKLTRPPELFVKRQLFNQQQSFEELHPSLVELFKAFRAAITKLHYGQTSKTEWDLFFRFGLDRLCPIGRGSFHLSPGSSGVTDCVNDNRDSANEWFKSHLIPWLLSHPRSQAYLLGDPGVGKSTLIKYLINTNSAFLRTSKVIFSRFEFLKFRENWCRDIEFKRETWPEQSPVVRTRLYEYISFIILRDVLWSGAYIERPDGQRARSQNFARIKNTADDITCWMTNAARGFPVAKERIGYFVRCIDKALEADRLDFEELRSVPHELRVLISKELIGDFKLILVIDGLDCTSLEDRIYDSARFNILDLVMRNKANLTTFDFGINITVNSEWLMYRQSISLPSSTFFVMREHTFYLHQDGLKNEIRMRDAQLFRLGPIDPEVAIYNVIARATEIWSKRASVEENEKDEVARLMVRATFVVLRFINRALGTGHPPKYILGLFSGNLRSLFDFMFRLLRWFVEDAIRDGLLTLSSGSTARDILKIMTGAAGLELLRRRSYRIVEILLFSDTPWFENRVSVEAGSGFKEKVLGTGPHYQDNSHFSGVVDNIFNYHGPRRVRSDAHHFLLEKIRIVQLLQDEALTSNELEGAMLRKLGYSSPELNDSLALLVRTQMITVTVREGEVYFSATSRGRITAQSLARILPYLEHVFHQTLFPDVLIKRINDERRIKDVDKWTAASIRNAFIFLSYIKFVENSTTGGKTVPAAFRIFEDTKSRVIESIRRILIAEGGGERFQEGRPESEDGSDIERRNWVVRSSLRMIDNLLNDWEQVGCATPSKPIMPP